MPNKLENFKKPGLVMHRWIASMKEVGTRGSLGLNNYLASFAKSASSNFGEQSYFKKNKVELVLMIINSSSSWETEAGEAVFHTRPGYPVRPYL